MLWSLWQFVADCKWQHLKSVAITSTCGCSDPLHDVITYARTMPSKCSLCDQPLTHDCTDRVLKYHTNSLFQPTRNTLKHAQDLKRQHAADLQQAVAAEQDREAAVRQCQVASEVQTQLTAWQARHDHELSELKAQHAAQSNAAVAEGAARVAALQADHAAQHHALQEDLAAQKHCWEQVIGEEGICP